VALDQAVEVVARMLGIEAPRELHRAERARAIRLPRALELLLEEAVVEARVVRDQHAPGEPRAELHGERTEPRRARDHVVGDAGERLDRRGDGGLRVDQRGPLTGDLAAVHLDHGDLGDAVVHRVRAGGLQVDDRQRRVEKAHSCISVQCCEARTLPQKQRELPGGEAEDRHS